MISDRGRFSISRRNTVKDLKFLWYCIRIPVAVTIILGAVLLIAVMI